MFWYWLGSVLALATVCVLAGPWLHRFINSQQRQADALHNIAGALLKRIEWEATCRRTDRDEAATRAVYEELEKRRRPAVVDDSALAPEAQSLLLKVRSRAPGPDGLYPSPKKPEPPPEAA